MSTIPTTEGSGGPSDSLLADLVAQYNPYPAGPSELARPGQFAVYCALVELQRRRSAPEPGTKYIEIGVMVELDDGLQTRMIDWYDERQSVLAGAKIYAVQPETKVGN